MQFPRIVVNGKTYAEGSGPNALRLARRLGRAAQSAGEPIAFAPAITDLALLGAKDLAGVPLFGQHVDAVKPGAGTGHVTAEMVAGAGGLGSLLNHAERKVPHAQVQAAIGRLHEVGLWSLACADSLAEARALAAFGPRAIAIEPPELIGGDVSVTTADPAIVRDAVQAVRKVDKRILVLCGAGVKTGADVAAALELGAHGVLLASGVVKATDPGKALKDLVSGLA